MLGTIHCTDEQLSNSNHLGILECWLARALRLNFYFTCGDAWIGLCWYHLLILHFFISAKIGIFYIIFYSCLAGFFAVMLVGFFATLDEKTPTQKKMYSLIKGNPGLHTMMFANLWW